MQLKHIAKEERRRCGWAQIRCLSSGATLSTCENLQSSRNPMRGHSVTTMIAETVAGLQGEGMRVELPKLAAAGKHNKAAITSSKRLWSRHGRAGAGGTTTLTRISNLSATSQEPASSGGGVGSSSIKAKAA